MVIHLISIYRICRVFFDPDKTGDIIENFEKISNQKLAMQRGKAKFFDENLGG